MDCFTTNQLVDTSAVVAHLQRGPLHPRQPPYCPICGRTFTSQQAANEHISERNCQSQNFDEIEGITADQVNALRDLPKNRDSVARWYKIWDIIYPNTPRPASPYVDNILQEAAGILRRGITRANERTPSPALALLANELSLNIFDQINAYELLSRLIDLILGPVSVSSISQEHDGNLSYLTSDRPESRSPAQQPAQGLQEVSHRPTTTNATTTNATESASAGTGLPVSGESHEFLNLGDLLSISPNMDDDDGFL
jgi:hypothetical protein